jgi:hypothetical protein
MARRRKTVAGKDPREQLDQARNELEIAQR